MTTSSELSFGGAIATRLLIGRDRQLRTVRQAIGRAARAEFRCVLVEADGGLGKTRLLREVASLLGTRFEPDDPVPPQGPWRYPSVLVLPLIDVADPYLHTIVPFLRAVREGLRSLANTHSGVERHFHVFDAAADAYDQARDGEMSFTEVALRRDKVIREFEAAYARLTSRLRVVWVIDTLEQLFRTRQEIDQLFSAAGIVQRGEQSTSSWLRTFMRQLPARTTLILAGRPQPQRWAADIETMIRAASTGDAQRTLTRIDLHNFTVAQIGEYLAALHTQLEAHPAFAHLAAYLRTNLLNDPEQPAILHLLTGGNPIRLAIYIDLLLNSDADVPAPYQNLAALRAMSPPDQAELRNNVDQTLLVYLTENLRSAEHQVIELLALMRRGLDLDRLCAIWRDDRPLAARTVRNLLRLSFVKYRWKSPHHQSNTADPDPEEIRIFLHDEFYAIYQSSFLRESRDQLRVRRADQHRLYQRLIDYCEREFRWRVRQIEDEQAQLNALTTQIRERAAGRPNGAEATFFEALRRATPDEQRIYHERKELLRRLRHERRQLRTESLHYELFDNPTAGFYETFFRRSEQAFVANAFEHDAQIQSELELFFFGTTTRQNGQQTCSDDEHWKQRWNLLRFAVVLQQVSSWIKRLTLYSRFADAQRLAAQADAVDAFFAGLAQEDQGWVRNVRKDYPGRQIEELFRLEWQANRYIAMIFEGLRVQEAITGLQETRTALEQILDVAELVQHRPRVPGMEDVLTLAPEQLNRFRNVVAQCSRYVGYGYATLSQFGIARREYLRGLATVEMTDFQTLRADLKNDLSRVLGELGDLDNAQMACQEGLAIRRARGFDYLRALSFNTMALIYSRNWLPLKARIWAEEALSLFRQLDQPRGIGLALLQVAESYRRSVSLMVNEAQLLRVYLRHGRLPLTQAARQRAEADLEAAQARLAEAEAIFTEPAEPGQPRDAKRVPELLRRIEVFTERAALFREWSVLHDEDATGPKYQEAMAALDEVIRLANPDGTPSGDYTFFHLAALVNQAQLHHKAGRSQQAAAALAQAEALVDPRYRLDAATRFDAGEAEVKEVYFRELGRIAALRATIELDREGDEAEIRYYMVALTYYQLYSPYEMPYLTLTRRRLAMLLDYLREMRDTPLDIGALVRHLKEEHHIYTLEPYLALRNEQFELDPRTGFVIDKFLK